MSHVIPVVIFNNSSHRGNKSRIAYKPCEHGKFSTSVIVSIGMTGGEQPAAIKCTAYSSSC